MYAIFEQLFVVIRLKSISWRLVRVFVEPGVDFHTGLKNVKTHCETGKKVRRPTDRDGKSGRYNRFGHCFVADKLAARVVCAGQLTM
jgi:hypothetical protein